jgi:hypothetical protein
VLTATQTKCNLQYSTFIFSAEILQNAPFKTQSNQQSCETVQEINHIVAHLLKARIVEPEETSIAREQHGINMTWCYLCGLCHVPRAIGMHATTEEMLEKVFSVQLPLRLHKEPILSCQSVLPGRKEVQAEASLQRHEPESRGMSNTSNMTEKTSLCVTTICEA